MACYPLVGLFFGLRNTSNLFAKKTVYTCLGDGGLRWKIAAGGPTFLIVFFVDFPLKLVERWEDFLKSTFN